MSCRTHTSHSPQAPILYLRPFTALRSLSLAGNPLCSEDGYQIYVIAYIPQLRYLDYRRISSDNVRFATSAWLCC